MVWFKCQTIAGAPAGGTDGPHSEQHECEERAFSLSLSHTAPLWASTPLSAGGTSEKEGASFLGRKHLQGAFQCRLSSTWGSWVLWLRGKACLWRMWLFGIPIRIYVWDSRCLYDLALPNIFLFTFLTHLYLISCFVLSYKLNKLRENIYIPRRETNIYGQS